MSFSLIKAIKSTHRHPISIGAPFYLLGIALILNNLFVPHTNYVSGIVLWSMAVGLFLLGHTIEGNLRAMTLVVVFKFVFRSRKLIAVTQK